MYRRSNRLTSSRDWQHVRRRGRCINGPLSLFCMWQGGDNQRFGFSTSRGFRNAVDRNRARRRLREAFRDTYRGTDHPASVVGVAKPPSLVLEYDRLRAHVASQLEALGLSTSTSTPQEI